jgi:hypothetical protein
MGGCRAEFITSLVDAVNSGVRANTVVGIIGIPEGIVGSIGCGAPPTTEKADALVVEASEVFTSGMTAIHTV